MSDSRSARTRGRERTSPVTFYRQVIAELRKVVWPSQQQLVTYLVVVLVFVVVVIAIVSLLDLAFGKAVFAVFGGHHGSTPTPQPTGNPTGNPTMSPSASPGK